MSDSSVDSFDYQEERSLIDSGEESEIIKEKKDKSAKINNSFTGPYPLDPADFKHNDKGANYQFEQLILQ